VSFGAFPVCLFTAFISCCKNDRHTNGSVVPARSDFSLLSNISETSAEK
jgi:hypothetical protein